MLNQLLKLLALTTMGFALLSCGQKEAATSLKVSTGLAMTNVSYAGGLTVSGVGPSGKTFTVNATSGSEIKIVLENGSWTFYVAAWTGPGIYGEEVHCGTLTTNLDSGTTSVNITATAAGCAQSVFTNGTSDLTVAEGFQNLKVFACSSSYMSGAPITTSTSYSSLMSGYCNGAGHPMDVKKRAGAMKLIVPGKAIEASDPKPSDLVSGCISFDGLSNKSLGLRIPTDKIPFKVVLFNDQACTQPEVIHDFPKGLQSGSNVNGIVMHPYSADENALILPFSISGSSVSPTYAQMPFISCSSTFCSTFPTIASAAHYILPSGFAYYRGIVLSRFPGDKCTDFAISNLVGLMDGGCSTSGHDDDAVIWHIGETTMGTCGGSSCSFDVSYKGGSPVTYSVKSDSSMVWSTYNDIARFVGGNPGPSVSNSLDAFDDGPFSYGGLDDIRQDLGPDGIMGIFGGTSCSALTGSKYKSVLHDGKLKMVQIIAKESTLAIPLQLCNASDDTSLSTCPAGLSNFDKLILFRELINSTWVTRQRMFIKCGAAIGMAESYHSDDEPDDYRDEQSLIYWNTITENNARYESYRKETRYSDQSRTFIEDKRRNFTRVQKTSAVDYYVLSNDYEFINGGTNSQERLVQKNLGVSVANTNDVANSTFSIDIDSQNDISDNIFMSPSSQDILEMNHIDQNRFVPGTGLFMGPMDNIQSTSVENRRATVFLNDVGHVVMNFFNGTSWNKFNIYTTSASNMAPRMAMKKINTTTFTTYVAWLANSGSIKLAKFDGAAATATPAVIASSLSVPSVSNLAMGWVGTQDKPDVFWTMGNYIYVIQKDELNAGDGASYAYAAAYNIIPQSLKVLPVAGSTTKLILVWMEDEGTNRRVKSVLYDSSVSTQASRFGALNTLASQPDVTDDPSNFRLVIKNSQAIYSWSTTGTLNHYHEAVAASGSAVFSMRTIDTLSHNTWVSSDCVDSTTFNNPTPGSCVNNSYPTIPVKPIKPGFDPRLRNMEGSIFDSIFTPLSTFTNLQ